MATLHQVHCPKLGTTFDPAVHYGYPAEVNICRARPGRVKLNSAHQEQFCLSAHYSACPFLYGNPSAADASRELPVPAALEHGRPWVDILIELMFGAAVLLGLVAVELYAVMGIGGWQWNPFMVTAQVTPIRGTGDIALVELQPTRASALASETPSLTPTGESAPSPSPTSAPTVEETREPTATPTLEPTRTPTPSPSPQPTETATATPTLTPTASRTIAVTRASTPSPPATPKLIAKYGAPKLISPANNSTSGRKEQMLVWTPAAQSLEATEVYEVWFWDEQSTPITVAWTRDASYVLNATAYPGFGHSRYLWRVRVIQTQGARIQAILSPFSDTWRFDWNQ